MMARLMPNFVEVIWVVGGSKDACPFCVQVGGWGVSRI